MFYNKKKNQKKKTKNVSNFDINNPNDNNENSKECNKLNAQKVNTDIDKDKDKDVYLEITKDFDQYSDIDDLKQYDINFLTKLYNNITYSLNSFHNNDNSNNNDSTNNIYYAALMKLHFICNNIIFTIEDKRYEDNLEKNKNIKEEMIKTKNKLKTIQDEMLKTQDEMSKMQNKIKTTQDEMDKTQKETIQTKDELKDIKNQINTILATIISIILSISIISSAIIGIEHINPNYILPYVSTLIFFGMIMIAFIFSIYKNEIKVRNWILMIFMVIIVVILWICSIGTVVDMYNPNTDIQKDSGEKHYI